MKRDFVGYGPNPPRVHVLARHQVRTPFFICGQAMQRHPEAARAVQQAGHEMISHGYRREEYFRMRREAERARIQQSKQSIRRQRC